MAQTDSQTMTPQQLQQEAIAISKLIRDPAAVNQTLDESEGQVASQLKAKIYELLREGKTREEIFDYMVERYGQMVLYQPDFNAGTAPLWLAPWVVLGATAVLVGWRYQRARVKRQQTMPKRNS